MNMRSSSASVLLGSVCEVQIGPFGSLLHKSDYVLGGVPVINPMHIVEDKIVVDASFAISPEKAAKLERYRLSPGEIILGRRGEMGRCAIVADLHRGMICGTGSMKLIPDRRMVSPDYLARLLRTPKARDRLENAASGVTIMNLNARAVSSLEIPLPPLAEQKRIAAILDQADALRRLRRRALDRLNTLGQAIFQEMFGDPEANPMNWQKRPLGQIGRLDRGVSKHRPRNDPALLGGSHPLIQTGDVSRAGDYIVEYGSTYSDLGLKQSRKWPEGTLCITIAANIADTALLGFDACFPDSVVGFDSGDEALNFFVHRWFATVRGKLDRIAPAVAQKNINLAILRDLPVIVPDRERLRRYYERETALRRCAQHFLSSEQATEAAFASLQHSAFTGQL